MRHGLRAVALTTLACCTPGLTHGTPLTNPGFETGDFTGWSVFTLTTTVVDGTFGLPPLEGDRSALVVFRNGSRCDPWQAGCYPDYPPVQTPLNPPGGPPMPSPLNIFEIDAVWSTPGFGAAAGGWGYGTGIGTTFEASAHQRIAFDLQLLTMGCAGCPFYSAAILKEVNVHLTQETYPAPAGLIGLGTFTADFVIGEDIPWPEPLIGRGLPGTGFDSATLPHTYTFEIPYDGTWQLFILGGHDFSGSPYSIGALVDNLRLVPEPGTLALLGLGLAGIGLSRRRKAA